MPVAAAPNPQPALFHAMPEINSGKKANTLGESNASHLNPFHFILEAGLNFVHCFHEHLSLKSFGLSFPTCHFSRLLLMVSKYSVYFIVFYSPLGNSGGRTALLGSSNRSGARFTH